eukprot:COSAG01_NODE_20687_length_940_cov_1.254459_1_plen_160_part_00
MRLGLACGASSAESALSSSFSSFFPPLCPSAGGFHWGRFASLTGSYRCPCSPPANFVSSLHGQPPPTRICLLWRQLNAGRNTRQTAARFFRLGLTRPSSSSESELSPDFCGLPPLDSSACGSHIFPRYEGAKFRSSRSPPAHRSFTGRRRHQNICAMPD